MIDDDEVVNAADEKKVKARKQKDKLKTEQDLNDVKILMQSQGGRRFMWRTLEDCKVFEECATNSGSWTYHNLGRRSVGLKILGEVMAIAPNEYLVMANEAKLDREKFK